MLFRKLTVFAVAALALAVPVQAGNPALYRAIAERLVLMQPVAAWKLARSVAVEDPVREAVVLQEAAEQAAAAGLDPASVRPFFRAQIMAAKAVQRCWIARWEAGNAQPPADPPDLKAEIRPELIRLGAAIVEEMHRTLAEEASLGSDAGAFAEAVSLECLDPAARDAILTTLGRVRLAD